MKNLDRAREATESQTRAGDCHRFGPMATPPCAMRSAVRAGRVRCHGHVHARCLAIPIAIAISAAFLVVAGFGFGFGSEGCGLRIEAGLHIIEGQRGRRRRTRAACSASPAARPYGPDRVDVDAVRRIDVDAGADRDALLLCPGDEISVRNVIRSGRGTVHTGMLTIILLLACSSDDLAPPGDWANVAPATALEVLSHDGHQLVSVQEAQWTFWVQLAPEPTVEPGDILLLTKGAAVDLVVDARKLEDVLAISDFAVVSPEAAAGALAIPDLPADRTSIAELHAERTPLAGTQVRAAGRIVKASMDVFDTNWYHLRDGTGSADDETDDLTFTTPAVLQVGDLVAVNGPLTADKDLGFGYFYPVILEGAAVTGLDGSPLAERSAAVDRGTSGAPRSMKPAPHVPAPAIPDPVQGAEAPGGLGVHGLTLGVSDDAAVDAWAAGLTCDRQPALARKTVHTTCSGTPADWTFAGSPKAQLLIARAEAGTTIHHISVARTHDDTKDAGSDFVATLASMTARLGEPLRLTQPADPSELDGRFAYTATWRYDDLEVGLSLMRLTPKGAAIVRERWFVPGAEAAAGDRGVGVHGAGMRAAPNPHLASTVDG